MKYFHKDGSIEEGSTDDFKDDYSDLGSLYVLSDSSFSDIGLNSLATNTSGNPFERSGFIFKEWNTKADGTGSHYQIGEDVSLNDINDSFSFSHRCLSIFSPTLF